MKTLAIEDMRKMDPGKLVKELEETQKALFKSRFEIKTGQSKDSHYIALYRKHIATIKTLLKVKSK